MNRCEQSHGGSFGSCVGGEADRLFHQSAQGTPLLRTLTLNSPRALLAMRTRVSSKFGQTKESKSIDKHGKRRTQVRTITYRYNQHGPSDLLATLTFFSYQGESSGSRERDMSVECK